MLGPDPESLQFGKRMPSPSAFGPARRRRFDAGVICFNTFLPWFLFSGLYSVMSFKMHYTSASVAWLLVLSCYSVTIICSVCAYQAKQRQRDPLWYAYAAVSCFIAVSLAATGGSINFEVNMKPFYQIETLNMYPSVSPARAKGSQLMDAGRVYFAEGTGIDMRRAMGFRNYDLYCVAPIVIGNSKLASYDFWAVGVNCCSGVSSDFRCGEYNNPSARAGLRLISENQRPNFRLAVQQAEAAYNITSTHPLFFSWVQDPLDEINQYQEAGFRNFLVGITTHFFFNVICVVGAVFGFATGSIGAVG